MSTRRVVVVGGGIAGLASAFRVLELVEKQSLDVEVLVLEADKRVGGKVGTENVGGFLCEIGPAGWLDNEPATLRLVEALGMDHRVLRSRDEARERYVMRKGKFRNLPMHPLKFMASPVLSLGGRLRMIAEMWQPARSDGADETVGDFGRRRLGREFTEVMLDSMVSGIYAGDVNRLSLAAAFPKVVALERDHGGLLKGMAALKKQRRKEAKESGVATQVEAGPGGVLHSFTTGMVEPIDVLAQRIGTERIRCDTRVRKLEDRDGGGARLHVEGPKGQSVIEADAVVLAVPAPDAAPMLDGFADEAARAMGEVLFAGVDVVCAGYRREDVEHHLHGFGALIPRREGYRILGTIWSSSTFDGQAPDGQVLLRTLVGGRHDPDASRLTEDELVEIVSGEIGPLYGLRAEPTMLRCFRWPLGIPQYETGHLDRLERARKDLSSHPGVFLTGNSVAGIGFNHCVAHSELVAAELAEFLTSASSTSNQGARA